MIWYNRKSFKAELKWVQPSCDTLPRTQAHASYVATHCDSWIWHFYIITYHMMIWYRYIISYHIIIMHMIYIDIVAFLWYWYVYFMWCIIWYITFYDMIPTAKSQPCKGLVTAPCGCPRASVRSDDHYPRRRPGVLWSCVASLTPRSSAPGARPNKKSLLYPDFTINKQNIYTRHTRVHDIHDGVPTQQRVPVFLYESECWSRAAGSTLATTEKKGVP